MSSGSSNLQAGAECEESDPLTTHCALCVHHAALTHTDTQECACGTCTPMMCDGADWYIRAVFLGPALPAPQYVGSSHPAAPGRVDKDAEKQELQVTNKDAIMPATDDLIHNRLIF